MSLNDISHVISFKAIFFFLNDNLQEFTRFHIFLGFLTDFFFGMGQDRMVPV